MIYLFHGIIILEAELISGTYAAQIQQYSENKKHEIT